MPRLLLIVLVVLISCQSSTFIGDDRGGGDADTDTDTDGDTDTDTGGDSDGDTDTDADTDADTDGDADTGMDTDTGSDSEADTSSAGDVDGDTDSNTGSDSATDTDTGTGDTDTDTDTEMDAGSDGDADTDTDTDIDADTDTDGDTDADTDVDADADTDTETDTVSDVDTDTGLCDGAPVDSGLWCDPDSGFLWEIAWLSYPNDSYFNTESRCDALTLGGVSWRLPYYYGELNTLIEPEGMFGCYWKETVFGGDCADKIFWTQPYDPEDPLHQTIGMNFDTGAPVGINWWTYSARSICMGEW